MGEKRGRKKGREKGEGGRAGAGSDCCMSRRVCAWKRSFRSSALPLGERRSQSSSTAEEACARARTRCSSLKPLPSTTVIRFSWSSWKARSSKLGFTSERHTIRVSGSRSEVQAMICTEGGGGGGGAGIRQVPPPPLLPNLTAGRRNQESQGTGLLKQIRREDLVEELVEEVPEALEARDAAADEDKRLPGGPGEGPEDVLAPEQLRVNLRCPDRDHDDA